MGIFNRLFGKEDVTQASDNVANKVKSSIYIEQIIWELDSNQEKIEQLVEYFNSNTNERVYKYTDQENWLFETGTWCQNKQDLCASVDKITVELLRKLYDYKLNIIEEKRIKNHQVFYLKQRIPFITKMLREGYL